MDIGDLIKNRKTIRKYTDKKIPAELIDKIIQAGVWGPSVVNFQPWKILVVTNDSLLKKIHKIVSDKVANMGVVGPVILKATAKAFEKSPLLILVFNTGEFVDFARTFGEDCNDYAKVAEISAISASIQNMFLVAETIGLGGCWHDTPLFCESEICKLMEVEDKLIAILSFGYPAENGKRAKRKSLKKMVKYFR